MSHLYYHYSYWVEKGQTIYLTDKRIIAVGKKRVQELLLSRCSATDVTYKNENKGELHVICDSRDYKYKLLTNAQGFKKSIQEIITNK